MEMFLSIQLKLADTTLLLLHERTSLQMFIAPETCRQNEIKHASLSAGGNRPLTIQISKTRAHHTTTINIL